MKTLSQADTTRHTILRAANQLIGREGVHRLTIEAVAREAGLSKGGVLYHFATKESLIAGLVAFYIEQFDADLAQAQTSEAGTGSWLRAYIAASALPDDGRYAAIPGIMAALAEKPELLEPLQTAYARWQTLAVGDGIDPVHATLIRLALDGLWLSDLLGLAPPQHTSRQAVIDLLRTLTQPTKEQSL